MIANKSRAEMIIERDPNGLVVVDSKLKVVQFNKAFLTIFDLNPEESILGKDVNELLNQKMFIYNDITRECSAIKHHKKTEKVVQLITFKLEEDDLFACFFVDITQRFHNKEVLQSMKKKTISKAYEVINNQMRVAQEIASLLGETTAESKSLLLNLINIMKEEDEINE